jgi:predicted nuclease of predicted toxin-antitoxin system
MRVLLDENLPRRLLRRFGPGVEAVTVTGHGWSGLKNGTLLRAAQGEFDAFVTADRSIPHQQNLSSFDLVVVILEAKSNAYEDLAPLMDRVNEALRAPSPGEAVHVRV